MPFLNTIDINKPIDLVFAEVSNISNYPTIFEHIEEVQKLTDGPIEAGTKFKETRLIRGFKAYSTLEITSYDPNNHFVIKNKPHGLIIFQDYRFESTEHGTRILLTSKVKTKGIRNLLTKPIITKILKKEDAEYLAQLKKHIEGQE